MKKRLFTVLLGMAVLLQSGSFKSAASVDSVQLHEFFTEDKQVDYCAEKPIHLFCKNEDEKVYSHGTIIKKEFEVDSYYDYDSYEIATSSCEGVEIITSPTFIKNDNGSSTVEIEFQVLDSCEIGSLCFVLRPLTSSENAIDNQIFYEEKIHCYHDAEFDYVSTISLYSLSDYSEKLKGYFSDIERQGEHIDNEKHYIEATRGANGITSYSLSVSGYISWNDSANGVHAADGVKVQLYTINGSTETYVGETTTSTAGGYSISFSSPTINQTVKLIVLAKGTNITVNNPTYETYNYPLSEFEVWGYAHASYTASNDSPIGQALSIQQGMTLANQYIYSLESSYLSNINVEFPCSGTSRYSSTYNKIYVEDEDAFDWDVIQHEYGHYVQDCYDIEDNPANGHSFYNNLADRYSSKSIGVRLAWGEGWATYFAINLQNKMSAASMYIPNVGDTHYQDIGTGIDVDIEYLSTNYRKGEANEATVCAVLYDMTDGYDSSEDDNVWFSNSDIWNITKSNNCTTLSEFITEFYASTFPFYTRLNLGSTLTRYNVAAALNSPTGLNTNTPTFSWTPQGGSTKYPNNSFSLVFYNSNYELILETDYTTSTSRQLTSNEWSSIKNSTSTVYYFVKAKQTPSPDTTPVTGPYYSTKMTLYPNS